MASIYISTSMQSTYRLSFVDGKNIRNITITPDGLYDVTYMKNTRVENHTGHIIDVDKNDSIPNNQYILFDYSEDNSNRRERIYLYQIVDIKDVTPINAYQIALDHGFEGSLDEWMDHMRGKSAYDYAVDHGFEGTIEEWMVQNGDITQLNNDFLNLVKGLEVKVI